MLPRSMHMQLGVPFLPIYCALIMLCTNIQMYTHTQLHSKHTTEFLRGAVIKRLAPYHQSGDSFYNFFSFSCAAHGCERRLLFVYICIWKYKIY